MTSVQSLHDIENLPAAQAVRRLEAALEEAERLGAEAAASTGLDREIIGSIHLARERDAVLGGLNLDRTAALLARCVERLRGGDTQDSALRRMTWDLLDLLRRPAVLRRISESGATGAWADRFLRAIEASHLTVGPLFRRRVETYGPRVLFEIPPPNGRSLNWNQAGARIQALARGLLSLYHPDPPGRIAILSENRPEMALVDLACLTSGIENVMIPANATDADVGYILRHAKVGSVVASTREQLEKIEKNRTSLPLLRHMVVIEPADGRKAGVMTLSDVEARADQVPASLVAQRGDAVRIEDLATVMYTSGTTGEPKGVQYSHRNLVFKRFARALALPEIGERDVFLCYLPLFHTFGRYLEMLGCIFWGAKYCFLRDPSVEALLEGMRTYRPTVFISVPRKWNQLYEAITKRADPLDASDEEVHQATLDLTGGRLRWGLSAAGYLDPDIFRFFHRQGTQLLSGFGMSEATGGITMTPPFEYKDNSLGIALPGIELKIAEDGELLIRGPYVMIGYLDPPDGRPSFDDDGWLHSGDLMRMDDEGHIRLVDRKKEIYKNVKGQTIAPQRIENLFREFASVGRVFLVGDHKEYNTLLIYPNPAFEELDFSKMSDAKIRDHFLSLVASVNKFVAPFERIVDFAIIDRDLDADKGELTPKGTPRRMTVVENFADVIEPMYRRAFLNVGGVDLTLPNWIFQTLGLTTKDVRVHGHTLAFPPLGTKLTVRRLNEDRIQVGACTYSCQSRALNLGALLATPRLWLGNDELIAFAPLELEDRQRPGRSAQALEWQGYTKRFQAKARDRSALDESMRHAEWSLLDLHQAAWMLGASDEKSALGAVRLLERVLSSDEDAPLAEPARSLLARAATAASEEVRRRAFQSLVPVERESRLRDTIREYFARDPLLLDSETRAVLCEHDLTDSKIGAFLDLAWEVSAESAGDDSAESLARSLMDLLVEYGSGHPTWFRRVRAYLVRVSLFGRTQALRDHAASGWQALRVGFFHWLGPTLRIAVDTETGQEYRWEDVVVFEEGTDEDDRRRLLSAIKNTPLICGSVFLLYGGRVVRLTDIPPGGVWIRHLGTRHGKAVYRISIQTRTQDSYDLAANLNKSLTPEQVRDEVNWLILCGVSDGREPVVEDFGGYVPDEDIWTEEFVSGATLDREMRRLTRRPDEGESLAQLWPFLAWSALSAYVDVWQRTGRRYETADLSPADIVVPTHDYHRGSRIVSLATTQEHEGILAMLQSFKESFVDPIERDYPKLQGLVGWEVVFSSVLEVVGEQEGLNLYESALENEAAGNDELRSALSAYVGTVRGRGFLPMRLFFAAKRYRRWARLNPDATKEARASTLKELYDTYGLESLAGSYPEARLRFFRETVFRDSTAELAEGLDDLIRKLRTGEMRDAELAGAVADLRHRLKVESDADYYLARIPFAYLRPEDSVDFVSADLGGEYQSEIVVSLEDADGSPFRVRHALSPKEVERLHRLFLAAKLDVRFGPEHRHLVAMNDKEQIIGGIYYTAEEAAKNAHLEKIVVAESYRRKGVADGLMTQFFNRLRAAGVTTVTTGFFRPEYFYSYGFKIERRYAGLVKELEEGASSAGADPVSV